MPLLAPRAEYLLLRRFTKELEKRYLVPHIENASFGTPTRAEELDVAAFAVLAHGAFENFVEGLSLWILERVQENWLAMKVSRSTASLMLNTQFPLDYDAATPTVFNVIRKAIDQAKATHSFVVEKNNGIALKHLRALLMPLGVDVPSDSLLTGSLDTLVKIRHEWAHQYRFTARTIKSAADTQKTVADCLQLAEQLYRNTAALKLGAGAKSP